MRKLPIAVTAVVLFVMGIGAVAADEIQNEPPQEIPGTSGVYEGPVTPEPVPYDQHPAILPAMRACQLGENELILEGEEHYDSMWVTYLRTTRLNKVVQVMLFTDGTDPVVTCP